MIDAHGLVKRYGATMAVNDPSFSIRPGMVTTCYAWPKATASTPAGWTR